jgi:hypothetical protein
MPVFIENNPNTGVVLHAAQYAYRYCALQNPLILAGFPA